MCERDLRDGEYDKTGGFDISLQLGWLVFFERKTTFPRNTWILRWRKWRSHSPLDGVDVFVDTSLSSFSSSLSLTLSLYRSLSLSPIFYFSCTMSRHPTLPSRRTRRHSYSTAAHHSRVWPKKRGRNCGSRGSTSTGEHVMTWRANGRSHWVGGRIYIERERWKKREEKEFLILHTATLRLVSTYSLTSWREKIGKLQVPSPPPPSLSLSPFPPTLLCRLSLWTVLTHSIDRREVPAVQGRVAAERRTRQLPLLSPTPSTWW